MTFNRNGQDLPTGDRFNNCARRINRSRTAIAGFFGSSDETPTAPPIISDECPLENVVITELASPEEPFAKYIELYFHECEGRVINRDFKIISFPEGDIGPDYTYIDLEGKTIGDDGFVTICNSEQAEDHYGRGACTLIGGLTSPANLRGTESIAIIQGKITKNKLNIIDLFGIPGSSSNNRQNFVNGRAVRKIHVWDPSPEYDYHDWHVFPQCGQEVGPEAMDINIWREVQGPICPPEATILITEIVDVDVDSSRQAPRYVELHAPRKRDRGIGFNHKLKLAIFHSDSLEPHWDSAIPIDFMPENGFLLVCNEAAQDRYGNQCAETSKRSGPGNSNGSDQIALISGDESSWFVVDMYGVIGKDGGKDGRGKCHLSN